MEPIIYKPGAYKSPGIYNGAGGIYKGRGVYNDGANKLKVWELDIDNLVLSNHTDDDGIEYRFQYSLGNYHIENGKLVANTIFDFTIIDFNVLGRVKKIEAIIDELLIGYNVFCGANGAQVTKVYNWTDYGVWLYDYGVGNWTVYQGIYKRSITNWVGYDHINLSIPIKYVLEYGDNILEFYLNDVKMASSQHSTPDTHFNFNCGGVSNNGNKIVLSSLKVYYE